MSGPDRRTVLRFAAAALLPSLLTAPARALAAGHFAPPEGPMLYTRKLRRDMAGGAAFTVIRSFSVRFVPDAGGYRVEGEPVAVEVEAPERLAQFARIERERRESGLFPLTLDAQGLIKGARAAIDTAHLEALVREATALIDRAGFSSAERVELDRFVSGLHRTASQLVTELPRDLFAPVDLERVTVREVPLPDGEEGEVTVRFTAQADVGTGLMQQATREVVTALSGDRRETTESWSLALI